MNVKSARSLVAVTLMMIVAASLTFVSTIAPGAAAHTGAGTFGPLSPVWYLAEGSTDWGFFTMINIENPDEVVKPEA